MKISEIIHEDTIASNIATVSFPLFGKPNMIRRAVDPHGYIKNKKKKPKNLVYKNQVK